LQLRATYRAYDHLDEISAAYSLAFSAAASSKVPLSPSVPTKPQRVNAAIASYQCQCPSVLALGLASLQAQYMDYIILLFYYSELFFRIHGPFRAMA